MSSVIVGIYSQSTDIFVYCPYQILGRGTSVVIAGRLGRGTSVVIAGRLGRGTSVVIAGKSIKTTGSRVHLFLLRNLNNFVHPQPLPLSFGRDTNKSCWPILPGELHLAAYVCVCSTLCSC